jgi:hypothetical protein
MGHNKAFDPSSQIEFIKNDLVGNVWSLFQVLESPFPLNPTIVLHGKEEINAHGELHEGGGTYEGLELHHTCLGNPL